MKFIKAINPNAQVLRLIFGYVVMGCFSIEIDTKESLVTIFIYETKSGGFFTVGLSESNECTFIETFNGETEGQKEIDYNNLCGKLLDISRGSL